MWKQKIQIYLPPLIFIFGWWLVAFYPQAKEKTFLTTELATNSPHKHAAYTHYLAPLPREVLIDALSGNLEMMGKLIADWDAEAQILASLNIPDIKRISNETFILAQKIRRECRSGTYRNSCPRRFLPQTYAAASFLLALAQPEQIVALPNGLREQKTLFSPTLLTEIPLDVSRYNGEKLFLQEPEIAFVADYSDPITLEAFENQGIQLVYLPTITNVGDVQKILLSMGEVIDKTNEATLLKIFIDAAILAMNNQLTVYEQQFPEKKPNRILYTNFHTSYSIPSVHSLTGSVLQHFGMNTFLPETKGNGWRTPLDYEQIVNLQPDILIISSINNNSSLIPASFNEKPVFFVDEVVQESPTQYIVLAYYDLYQAILGSYHL